MKIAIITGASSGLGREFARDIDMNEKLDEIWLIARRTDRLNEVKATLRTPARVIPADLTNPTALDFISGMLDSEQPDVRILVNAAGFGKIGPVSGTPVTELCDMIDLNCRAAVAITRVALPYVSRGSRIIEICSTSAFQPMQYLSTYAATKAFLLSFSRSLGRELKNEGVTVTAVCPYWVTDTEFIAVSRMPSENGYIRSFPFATKTASVVRTALRDSIYGRAVSTPGFMCSAHRVIRKLFPDSVLMLGWDIVRNIALNR